MVLANLDLFLIGSAGLPAADILPEQARDLPRVLRPKSGALGAGACPSAERAPAPRPSISTLLKWDTEGNLRPVDAQPHLTYRMDGQITKNEDKLMKRINTNIWFAGLFVFLTTALIGCGDSSGIKPVSVDMSVPQTKDYAVKLSGMRSAEFSGNGVSLSQRGGETSIDFSAVTPNNNENMTVMFSLSIGEGKTGTFESKKNPRVILGSGQYLASKPVRVKVLTYSGGTFEAEFVGTFDTNQGSGSKVNNPLKVEGKLNLDY